MAHVLPESVVTTAHPLWGCAVDELLGNMSYRALSEAT